MLQFDPIIVENPDASNVIDPNIMFGKGYKYRVRTIVYSEFSAINTYPGNESRNQEVVVGMLIASRPSASVSTICLEKIAPKPPADIDFTYNSTDSSVSITWSFPINRQRDIKQFRVFKRSSISDPYSLIKGYFFDDSTTLTSTSEIPYPSLLVESPNSRLSGALIQVVDFPNTMFKDSNFDFNGKNIYALTSVDARGMSSNYSQQFEVTYDKFTGRLNVKYLSRSGAPIPYPNLYLKNDLFVDTIKTSGFNQMTVYFDPEYLSVINSDSETEEDIVSTDDENPSYKISMINLDNQKSKNLDIYVKDIRNTTISELEGVEYEVTTRVATLIDTST
jgi:hypothetical protein